MKKVLKLKFKTAEGKTSMITVRYPKQDLSSETVKSAMQKIVKLQLNLWLHKLFLAYWLSMVPEQA